MELTPTQIRRKTFELVRRGFDPQEVGRFLETVAELVAGLDRDLDEARQALAVAEAKVAGARASEEAVHLTIAAATQAKEEMLAKANSVAAEVRGSAEEEAEQTVAEARREALGLLEDSRRDAEEMVAAAHKENLGLTQQVERLRSVVDRTKELLEAIAGGSLDQIGEASELLRSVPRAQTETQAAISPDGDGRPAIDNDSSVALPDAVDQLLDQLRGGS